MTKNEKLYELEETLKEINWDIIGLPEIKRRGEQVIELHSGNRLYYKGNEKVMEYGGIAFLVKKNLKNQILKFKPVSDRIAYLIVQLNKIKLKIVQVYAPTTTSEDEEIETFTII